MNYDFLSSINKTRENKRKSQSQELSLDTPGLQIQQVTDGEGQQKDRKDLIWNLNFTSFRLLLLGSGSSRQSGMSSSPAQGICGSTSTQGTVTLMHTVMDSTSKLQAFTWRYVPLWKKWRQLPSAGSYFSRALLLSETGTVFSIAQGHKISINREGFVPFLYRTWVLMRMGYLYFLLLCMFTEEQNHICKTKINISA